MINYKKMAVAVLLSCVAFSFQVQALSRCFERIARRSLKNIPYGGALSYYLACKKRGCEPAQVPAASITTSSTSVHSVDEAIVRKAKAISLVLIEKFGRDVAGVLVDYFSPAWVRVITITKDQILGPLQACCADLALNDRNLEDYILRQPTLSAPLKGLYKPWTNDHGLPSIRMSLNFSEESRNKYLQHSHVRVWICHPFKIKGCVKENSIQTNAMELCSKCQKIIYVNPDQHDQEPGPEARKWTELSSWDRMHEERVLYDIEITGWDEAASAGSGIAMHIYKEEDEKIWRALIKLREDARAKTAKLSLSSSNNINPSCSSSESAQRAAALRMSETDATELS